MAKKKMSAKQAKYFGKGHGKSKGKGAKDKGNMTVGTKSKKGKKVSKMMY